MIPRNLTMIPVRENSEVVIIYPDIYIYMYTYIYIYVYIYPMIHLRIHILVGSFNPLKNHGVKVSWDYEIPN